MARVSSVVGLLTVIICCAGAARAAAPTEAEAAQRYRWERRHAGYLPLSARIPPPPGFSRVEVEPDPDAIAAAARR